MIKGAVSLKKIHWWISFFENIEKNLSVCDVSTKGPDYRK